MNDTNEKRWRFGSDIALSLLERRALWPLWFFVSEAMVSKGWIGAYHAEWTAPDRYHWVYRAVSEEACEATKEYLNRFGQALQRLIPWTDLYEKGSGLMGLKVTLDNTMLQLKLGYEMQAMEQEIFAAEEDVEKLGIAMDGLCQKIGLALQSTREMP